jgi:hypothetical protein
LLNERLHPKLKSTGLQLISDSVRFAAALLLVLKMFKENQETESSGCKNWNEPPNQHFIPSAEAGAAGVVFEGYRFTTFYFFPILL